MVYLVGYATDRGHGNIEIKIKHKPKTIEQVQALEKEIEKEIRAEITILGITRLRAWK